MGKHRSSNSTYEGFAFTETGIFTDTGIFTYTGIFTDTGIFKAETPFAGHVIIGEFKSLITRR